MLAYRYVSLFWQVWMISAICTPTALSCRCMWAVTNSHMRANCLRSGRTIASLFLSSWSRYRGKAAPATHTYKKTKTCAHTKWAAWEHVNYYCYLLFLSYFWNMVVHNWLLICSCYSSRWSIDSNVLHQYRTSWSHAVLRRIWTLYLNGFYGKKNW